MAHTLPAEKRRVVVVDDAAQCPAVAKTHGKVIDLMAKHNEDLRHSCDGGDRKGRVRSERCWCAWRYVSAAKRGCV